MICGFVFAAGLFYTPVTSKIIEENVVFYNYALFYYIVTKT